MLKHSIKIRHGKEFVNPFGRKSEFPIASRTRTLMRYSMLFLVFVYFFKFCVYDFLVGLRLTGTAGG